MLVIGLIAFALWQVVAAVLGFRWVDGEERFRKRVGAVSKAVVGLLAGAAALFADPNRAGGLDVALRALGGTGLGRRCWSWWPLGSRPSGCCASWTRPPVEA